MYKPQSGWEKTLKANIQSLENEFTSSVKIEYIIVNDGFENDHLLSLFDVIEDAQNNIRFISYNKNMGKGYALRTGVAAATASTIVTTDFDFPYQPKDIKNIYSLIISGAEIVTGKRKQDYYVATPFKRKLISKACIAMNKHLLNISLGDTQSGLKGFNKKGKSVFLQTTINRFLVDTEFLLIAQKRKLKIAVVDINARENLRLSTMGWKVMLAESKNFYKLFIQNSNYLSALSVKEKYVQQTNIADIRS